MPIANLTANVPALAAHFERVTTVYIKQYGPGNLRIGSDRDSLLSTVSPAPVADGLVQITADNFKQYFWEGDLWLISDQNGAVVLGYPSDQFYIDRGKHSGSANSSVRTAGELEGDLSTY